MTIQKCRIDAAVTIVFLWCHSCPFNWLLFASAALWKGRCGFHFLHLQRISSRVHLTWILLIVGYILSWEPMELSFELHVFVIACCNGSQRSWCDLCAYSRWRAGQEAWCWNTNILTLSPIFSPWWTLWELNFSLVRLRYSCHHFCTGGHEITAMGFM